MTNKLIGFIRYLIIPALAALLCFLLLETAADTAGWTVVEWFTKVFTVTRLAPDTYGNMTEITEVDWYSVKRFILAAALVVFFVGTLIIMVVSDRRKRRLMQRSDRKAAEYMQRFILNGEPLPAEIPEEYAQVFAKISETRYEMERRAAALNDEARRKNELITYLAHDLKTPLTSVIGYLDLLRTEPELPEAQRAKFIETAARKAERLEELTSELFEMTRFDLSNIELQKENIDLSLLLEQTVSEFEPLLAENGLTADAAVSPGVRLFCDADKLERVIDNLIRNAIKYSYRGSVIRIALSQSEGQIRLIFENHGKTIPPAKLERIFEQFYRADPSRSSATGGSGLGLAIAKRLTEAHGGTITAYSENELVRFTVILPRQ